MPPARRQEPSRLSIHPLFVALAGAVAVAAALVAASLIGSSTGKSEATPPPVSAATPAVRDELFRGVLQDGITLGSPKAPVTLVEFADLQCPYCADWARDALPTIVQEYVRAGRVRLVFRGLSFVGEQSDTALRAALAAGEQDRLWDVLHGLYLRQGAENSGWVTDSLLRSFGGAGLDAEQMLDSTRSSWVESQLLAARNAATPSGSPARPSSRPAGPAEPPAPERHRARCGHLPARAGSPARGMNDRILRAALVALSLAGAAVSGYVLYARWTDAGLLCSTGGCETVQSSEYSQLLGVPVAALGLVGYLVMGALASARDPRARTAVAALALAAAGFGGYLLVVQLTVIDAVCDWCLASDAISSLIAVVALARLLQPGSGRAALILRVEQPFGERVAHQLCAASEVELLHDVRPVGLGRADRDEELLGDLLVRVPEREQVEHLALTL